MSKAKGPLWVASIAERSACRKPQSLKKNKKKNEEKKNQKNRVRPENYKKRDPVRGDANLAAAIGQFHTARDPNGCRHGRLPIEDRHAEAPKRAATGRTRVFS